MPLRLSLLLSLLLRAEEDRCRRALQAVMACHRQGGLPPLALVQDMGGTVARREMATATATVESSEVGGRTSGRLIGDSREAMVAARATPRLPSEVGGTSAGCLAAA